MSEITLRRFRRDTAARTDSQTAAGTIEVRSSGMGTIERQIRIVILLMRDPRVPWYCKAVSAGAVGYSVSPVTLIPDWIPVVGLLDNLLVLGLGMWLVEKLAPRDVLSECRHRAATRTGEAAAFRSHTAKIAVIAVLTIKIIVALIFSGVALILLRSTPIRGYLPGG